MDHIDQHNADPVTPGPIEAGERIGRLDVLRGVALLGIFVMNIPSFALPEAAFFNPIAAGGFEGGNRLVWILSHVFFDMKMMAIFSMLFGAGILVMDQRCAATGRSSAAVHYRRMAWLLLIGMLHAYLIWFGDILVAYALCGMALFVVRRFKPRTLCFLAAVFFAIGVGVMALQGMMFDHMRSEAMKPDPPGWAPDAWRGLKADFMPSPAELEAERATYLGGYMDLLPRRATDSLFMQIYLIPAMLFWRAGGLMMLGMALMKWRVLEGARGIRTEAAMVVLGYALGIPLIVAGYRYNLAHDFDFVDTFKVGFHFNYVGSIGVALGHVGAILLICRSVRAANALAPVAAVGRMALTNYLTQSLIAAAIFYGWGFGRWGSLDRVGLMGVVAGVWVAQLIWSPIWLSRFRYGPAEWVWRSLTYWRVLPLRKG